MEKEKEEKGELQEMFEIIELDHKKSKSENVSKLRDSELKTEDLLEKNGKLTEMKDEFEKKCNELQVGFFFANLVPRAS